MNPPIDFRAVAEEFLAANPQSGLYFLLDQSGMAGLHRKLVHSSTEWMSLFEGTKEHSALSVAPILVSIGANRERKMVRSLLRWIGEKGTYTSTVIMIASPLPLESLRRRLAARLVLRLSENMEAMLRFFDPRVFEHLAKMLSVEQAKTFFSPAHRWWFVDRAGELVGFDTQFNAAEENDAPVTLSASQEHDLVDASEPDQVISLLRENAPDLISTWPLPTQYEFVVRQIQGAKERGLVSTVDFVLYAATALAKGENFMKGPIIDRIFEDARSNHIDFSDAIAAIDIRADVRGIP